MMAAKFSMGIKTSTKHSAPAPTCRSNGQEYTLFWYGVVNE